MVTRTPQPSITCEWCEQATTRAPRHGRLTRRHKCPHGVWCPRAQPLHLHDNHYPMGGPSCCDVCRKGYWARERARVEAAGQREREGRR
jgi:hypothetical protein